MDKLNNKSVDEILSSSQQTITSTALPAKQWHTSKLGGSALNLKPREVKIPKEIMQTWKTNDVPNSWKPSPQSIKRLMPTWNYTLMTDEANRRFVQLYFPDFLFYFDGFEYPIQRADAIRYMWLYVKGGLYIDLDLELVKPLDELFFEDADLYVVKSAIMNNVYTNAFMAAKPRLQLMLRCLEEMKAPYSYWHVGKHLKVVNSTGPNMFTKAIQKEVVASSSPDRNDSRLKLKVAELPGDLIIVCSICDPKPCSVDNGYCRLLGGSSWSEGDTAFWTSIYCNRRQLIFLFVVIVIVIAVVIIVYKKRRYKNKRY